MRTVENIQHVLLSLTLAACGGGSGTSPDAAPPDEPDAPPDAPPATTIAIDTADAPPDLIAVRDGLTAAWQVLPNTTTAYSIQIHGPYMVTVVCDDKVGDIEIWQFARSPGDDTRLDAPCFVDPGAAGDPHAVTGTMAQAGTVALGFAANSSTTPNWSFDLALEDGAYDLIATSTDRAVVRRNVAVAGDTAVAAIDLAQGAAMAATPVTAPNATASETLTTSVTVFTGTTFAFGVFSGAPAATVVLPDSVLVQTDNQALRVTATDGTSERSVRRSRFHAAGAEAFTLPDRLTGTSFSVANGTVTAHWGTLPPRDSFTADLFAANDTFTIFLFHDLDIGPVFAADNGSVTLDNDIPGFNPAWKVDVAKPYSRELSVSTFGASETATARLNEDVNATGLVRRQALRHEDLLDARRARRAHRR